MSQSKQTRQSIGEHVECRTLSVLGDDGVTRVHLSVDENGGRVDIADIKGEGGGMSLCFDFGMPVINMLDKNANLGLTLAIDLEGGLIQVIGSDRKVKHLLFIENGEGKMLSGIDVLDQG